MNHLNFKTGLTIITVILCSVILWGCSAQNAPSKTELKKDLSLNDTVVAGINGSEKFSVEDINITLADSNDDIYKAEITVYLKNSIYTAQKGVSVTYNHYDTGGWKLEELAASNATNINVLSGHPETAAIKTARESYEHAIITDRKTDLKTKQDIFTFAATKTGKHFDYTINFQDTYSAANGAWTKTARKILNSDYELHQVDGIYYDYSYADRNFYQAFHIDDISKDTATVSFIYFDSIDESGSIETHTRALTFDAETLTFKMDGYTIAQNQIKGATLSHFYEHQWTREHFYQECKRFVIADRDRHIGEYDTDPSSSIVSSDVYGVWIGDRSPIGSNYYYYVAPYGVNYDINADVKPETQSSKNYGFYGYDPQERCYIVYYIKNHSVATLKFIKTKGGSVQLKTASGTTDRISEIENYETSPIVGSWRSNDTTLVFNEDGTGEMHLLNGFSRFYYTISNKVLSITINEQVSSSLYILKNDTLNLLGDSYKGVYTRQK